MVKCIWIGLTALFMTASALAQGWVQFNNRVLPFFDAQITFDGTGGTVVGAPVTGAGFVAELVNVANGAVVATTTFRDGVWAGYINPVTAVLPGVPGGTSVSLIVRAYGGASSYQAAKTTLGAFFGESAVVRVVLTEVPANPPSLNELRGFSVFGGPEPSTIAIGALGLAAFLLRRRK